jgi:hypothetical protein
MLQAEFVKIMQYGGLPFGEKAELLLTSPGSFTPSFPGLRQRIFT